MAIKEYHLYRAKFVKPRQMPLLAENMSPSQIFEQAISDKPSLTLKYGNEWHIGNISNFDENSGSFAVGRTTKTTFEKFDTDSGDFVDALEESGPYTLVVFDSRIGLLGIAKKSKLAPNAEAISRKIKGLFENSRIVIETGVEPLVDYIPDPEGFIQKMRASYSIKKFKASFTGPNPVDADELFQKPLSVYAKEMGAEKGFLEVTGQSLNEDMAEQVAKSTAATGNTASARIVNSAGAKATLIKMEGDAVIVSVDEDANLRDVLKSMREEYGRVRG